MFLSNISWRERKTLRPIWEDAPGEGKGYPLQYSGLENSMDCIVLRVTKSWTGLSDFHFLSLFTPVQETNKFFL